MNVGKPFMSKRILSMVTDVVLLFLLFFLLSWASMVLIVKTNPTYKNHESGYTEILLDSGIYTNVDGKAVIIQGHFEEGLTTFYQKYEGKEQFLERKSSSLLFDENGKAKEDVEENQVLAFYHKECSIASSIIHKDADFAKHYLYVFQAQMINYIVCLLISSFVLEVLIPLILKDGRTIGKRMHNLALVHQDGCRIHVWQVFVRYVAYMVINVLLGIFSYGVLPMLSFLFVFLNKYGKSFHDFIAGTIMVDELNYKIEDRVLEVEAIEHVE